MFKAQVSFAAGLGIGLVGGGQLAALKAESNSTQPIKSTPEYIAQIERLVSKTHFENVHLKQEMRDAEDPIAAKLRARVACCPNRAPIDQTERSG